MSPHDDSPATTSGEGAPLVISVRSATGTGQTPLSAFDDALHGAGVGDLNLIPLSSVVPPSAEIRRGDHSPVPATHGDRLYCVLSVANAELRGASAWAGIGWTHAGAKGGYFVEHHGGTIWIDNDYTDGTRFLFTLPTAHAETADTDTAAPLMEGSSS